MAANSKIEWTDATINPIRARNRETGKPGWHCEKVSPACANCYSERLNIKPGATGGTGLPYKPGHRDDIELFLHEHQLLQPLRWKRPRRIFVCSMTDLFADFVPDEWIDRVFAVMALCAGRKTDDQSVIIGYKAHHDFQLLTKRPHRMRQYISGIVDLAKGDLSAFLDHRFAQSIRNVSRLAGHPFWMNAPFSVLGWLTDGLPGLWLGVTAEDQPRADERREDFEATPAAVKFVSYEPALGPVNWRGWEFVNQIIFGGESGRDARIAVTAWARATRSFCAANAIAYFHKQNGEWIDADAWLRHLTNFGEFQAYGLDYDPHRPLTFEEAAQLAKGAGYRFEHLSSGATMLRVGKSRAGRLLDGREHNDFPEARS
jgi:protein gp37